MYFISFKAKLKVIYLLKLSETSLIVVRKLSIQLDLLTLSCILLENGQHILNILAVFTLQILHQKFTPSLLPRHLPHYKETVNKYLLLMVFYLTLSLVLEINLPISTSYIIRPFAVNVLTDLTFFLSICVLSPEC